MPADRKQTPSDRWTGRQPVMIIMIVIALKVEIFFNLLPAPRTVSNT